MDEFTAFLLQEVRLQLDAADDASTHDEVEEATTNARRYLDRLEEKLGGK